MDTLFTSNAEVIKYDSENTNIWKDIDSTVVTMLEGALDSRKQARVKLTDERQLNGMYMMRFRASTLTITSGLRVTLICLLNT